MKNILVTIFACSLSIAAVAPAFAADSSGCTVTQTTPKNGPASTQVFCTAGFAPAASYLTKLPFKPVVPKLQSTVTPTLDIFETAKKSATLSIEYNGDSSLSPTRRFSDVRIVEDNAKLPGTGSKARRWQTVATNYARDAKRLQAQVLKLANGHPAVWLIRSRTLLLLSHGVSVSVTGTSARGSLTVDAPLSSADALAIANSLQVWHKS